MPLVQHSPAFVYLSLSIDALCRGLGPKIIRLMLFYSDDKKPSPGAEAVTAPRCQYRQCPDEYGTDSPPIRLREC